MEEGQEARLAEAVRAASVAGSYRVWARLEPRLATALEEKAQEWRASADRLLADWLAHVEVVVEADWAHHAIPRRSIG